MKHSWHVQRVLDWMPPLAADLGLQWIKMVNPPSANPFPGVANRCLRFWHDSTQNDYIRDGYEGGRRWVRHFLPRMRERPWATCFETANEPDCNSNEGLANLRLYSLGAMREASDNGIKLCILNLSEGNPHDNGIGQGAAAGSPQCNQARAAERWKLEQLAEAVQYAAENGHYVGLHCYWLPSHGIGPLDRWHGLGRLEWNVEQWISMGVNPNKLRVLVNETGVDGLIKNLAPFKGWRSQSTLGDYAFDTAIFDARAQALPWLVAYMHFTYGYEGEWGDYDHRENDARVIGSGLAQTPPDAPTPPSTPPDEDLADKLQNGNFRNFRYWTGLGEVWLAESWEPFWSEHDPARPSYDRRPEYRRCGDETVGPRRAPEGQESGQQWFNWSGHHRAGIMQRVAVPAGQRVRFSVQAMAWYSTKNDPNKSERNADDPGYRVQVGIDPTGGADWMSPQVVWSAPVYPHDAWHTLSVEAVSQGVVTVFVYGEPTWPVVNVNCYVGDARLVPVDAEPPSESLGDWIQQFVVPLNKDTAIAKSAKARNMGLLPASDEQQNGDYIVQAWRSAQDDSIQHIAVCKIPQWDKVTWTTRKN